MSDSDLEVNVYHFQGSDDEKIPLSVEELIVEPGVQVLRNDLCGERGALRNVTLPKGLRRIGGCAFLWCQNLLQVSICSTVQFIGRFAFQHCARLTKVDFENTSSSPHQLVTIGNVAFGTCRSLQKIKLPSSVTKIGEAAFYRCVALTEVHLLTTEITNIYPRTFFRCSSLQTVSLPTTLKQICHHAFCQCFQLATVVVPRDSQPIEIGSMSFFGCRHLANLVLPNDSTAEEDSSFTGCELLHERYGEDSSEIVAGLEGRFDGFSIHRMCYDHSAITVQELRQCITDQKEGDSLVDEFGMTPFHVFFSTAEPSVERLDVLLDSLPHHILLKLKDANSRRPLDYLITNWTDENATLLHRTVQKWMIDPLARWGATSWMEAMQSTVQELLDEDDQEERAALCNEAYSTLEHCENLEATSILEMALWKWKLKSGWTSDGTKRPALDRDECRCLSGSDVVIPQVSIFFFDPVPREEEEEEEADY